MSDFVRKDLWLATNFACMLLKQGNGLHTAIRKSLSYYTSVNQEEIEEQIRKRQSKGQKGKKRGSMKTWIFKGEVLIGYRGDIVNNTLKEFEFKALNRENAEKRLWQKYEREYGNSLTANERNFYLHGFDNIKHDLKEVVT